MQISQAAHAVVRVAEEHAGEPAINPWLVGGIALAILLLMLMVVVWFGGGRDHS